MSTGPTAPTTAADAQALAALDDTLAREAAWHDAVQAAVLLAVDPMLGGAALRARAGPVRDRWLAAVQRTADGRPWRRLPAHIADDRLLGGLDLGATLQAGRPVAQRGLLAECDGGWLVAPMAERLESGLVARLCAVMDRGLVAAEREGLSMQAASRFVLLALDEGDSDDERLCAALLERLAFHLDFTGLSLRDTDDDGTGGLDAPSEAAGLPDAAALRAARERLPTVHCPDDTLQALCTTALALGVDSVRATMLALRVARASAALDGRDTVSGDDASVAARLVLAPRATRLPAPPPPPEDESAAPPPPEDGPPEPPPPPPPPQDPSADPPPEPPADPPLPDNPPPLEDLLLAAAQAALPPQLLALLLQGKPAPGGPRGGRAGQWRNSPRRGRPAGVRRGLPVPGARLDLVATLRAAAPWQPVRRAQRPAGAPPRRLEVRPDDFHTPRLRQRSETTAIFLIDASGSSALNRLAEAKGAVELLLADCYVRRDQVAVLSFRGAGAELLLPPTRSLVRAKRSLAGLPGGGGTPLATGLQAAAEVALAARRRGESPLLVLLTDGRANIARDGRPGRAQAEADALAMARELRAMALSVLLVDTSPQPAAAARRLADALGARYLALPYAGSAQLSVAVQAAMRSGDGR